MCFIFENFYVKSDYDKMNIVGVILVKITFKYIVTKKNMIVLYFTFKNILLFYFYFSDI